MTHIVSIFIENVRAQDPTLRASPRDRSSNSTAIRHLPSLETTASVVIRDTDPRVVSSSLCGYRQTIMHRVPTTSSAPRVKDQGRDRDINLLETANTLSLPPSLERNLSTSDGTKLEGGKTLWCHMSCARLEIDSFPLSLAIFLRDRSRMHKLLDWDNATNLLSREASLRAIQLILSIPQQQQQQQQQQSLVGDNVAAAAAIMTRHGEAIVPLGRQLPEQLCPHDERVHRAELQLMAQAHRISLLEEQQHQYSATGLWASNRLPTSQHPLYHQVHQEQPMEQQVKMLLAMQAHNRQRQQQHHHQQQQQLLAEQLHQQQRELNAAVMLQCLATAVSPPAVATSHAHHLRPRSDHHQERAP
jgi:hypothetical protein